MILTCPACATRYFVGDDAVSGEGRVVRCASCGESWRALPQPAAHVSPAPLELTPAPAAAAAPVSTAFRQQAQARHQARRAATAGVVWACAGAAAAMTVLAAVLFPAPVVRMAPRMAGVYAALGRPVNPTGLALEAEGQPGLIDGRAVTVVSGLERNVEAGARPATPVRVTFFDKAGRPLVSQLARPQPGPIPPGETRPFRAVFTNPPLAAVDYLVEFAFDAGAPASRPHAVFAPPARPAAAAPAGPAPRPVTVTEARPLPPGSPYALPPAAGGAPHG